MDLLIIVNDEHMWLQLQDKYLIMNHLFRGQNFLNIVLLPKKPVLNVENHILWTQSIPNVYYVGQIYNTSELSRQLKK